MKNTAYPSSSQPAQEATSRPVRHATKMASIPNSASFPGGYTPTPRTPQLVPNENGRQFTET